MKLAGKTDVGRVRQDNQDDYRAGELPGDAAWALSEWQSRADSWFLDGFAPARNPGMWSDAVLDGVRARSAPGARVATFTVAGAVRRGLAERGFEVAKRPGHGRKRERLEAWLPDPTERERASGTVAVIGSGIAGAAVARALTAAGRDVAVIEAPEHAMASGFPASLVTPRFDLGDEAVAALHAQALERAGALYAQVPDAVIARGVTRLGRQASDGQRFQRIASQPIWPDGALQPALDGTALNMTTALVVEPAAIRSAWLTGVRRQTGRVVRLDRDADDWRLIGEDGAELCRAAQVVIAAGWGSSALAPTLSLRPVRGQAEWVEGASGPALAWGGYIAPTRAGLLYGATHQRGDLDATPRDADSAANLETLRSRAPDLAALAETATNGGRRAAIRATTSDHLPVCGLIDQGLAVLSGLGGRGFCLAPLLGEHLAAGLVGAPSPLLASLSRRLSPARLLDRGHGAT